MSRSKIIIKSMLCAFFIFALAVGCVPATTSTPAPIEKETSEPVVEEATTKPESTISTDPITIGFAYGAFTPQEKWEAYFSGFLAENPNVTIKYYPVPLDEGWGDYTQKIITLIVGGEQIDLIWDAIEAVPLMAEKGVLAPLNSFIENDNEIQEYIDDVHPKLIDGLKWKGQQYLLPFAWNNVLMYYNKNLFKAAGLAEPEQDWTWDEFLTDAQKITEDVAGDGENQVYGYKTSYSMWGAGPWTISNGTFWISEDFTEPWYDNEKTIESVQFAYDLMNKYKVSPSGDYETESAFAANLLGMFGGAPATREGLIPAGVTPDDYDINYWPSNTGETITGSIWGTDGYGITQQSKNKEMAWKLLKTLMSKEVMSNLVDGTNASGSAPARRSLATGEEFAAASSSNFLYWYGSLDSGRTVVNPPSFATLGEIHNRYLSQAWAGEMSIEDAMSNIQSEMEAELSNASQ